MNTRDLATYTPEEIPQLVIHSSEEDLNKHAAAFTPEQSAAATLTLGPQKEPRWREKLSALIQGSTDNKQLEAIGRSLTLAQAHHILDETNQNVNIGHWKLSPLFVGIPHGLFTRILLTATTSQMNVLKQEVITEPLQHHLTVLTHEIVHQIPEFSAKLDDLENEIARLDPREMDHSELRALSRKIEEGEKFYDETFKKITKALTLAWNTNRTDLIDKLSLSKEITQKLIGSIVGTRRGMSAEPSGLFAKLEDRLNRVYGLVTEPQDIEALDDDEPAIEALVKLSIWYLKDYWDIGLLPKISDGSELDLESSELSHDEKIALREKWYQEVIDNLSNLGLNCVKDLKNARIYSKSALIDYISRNKRLLS